MLKRSILVSSLVCMMSINSIAADTKEKSEKKLTQNKQQLQLLELLNNTVKNDPLITSSQSQIQTSELKSQKEIGGWLPKVDLTVYSGRENIKNADGSETTMGMAESKLDVKQLIYDFKIDSQIKKSNLDVTKSNLSFQSTTQNVLLRNISAYFNSVKTYEQYNNAIKSQQNIQRQMVAENKKLKAGSGNKTDLLEAQASYQRALVVTNNAKLALNNAITSYARSFYAYPVDISKMQLPKVPYNQIPKSLDDAKEIALKTNPALLINTIELDKLKLDSKIDRAKFLPKFEFVGKLQEKDSVSGTNGHKSEYLAKVEMSYNLYNGGRDSIDVKLNQLRRVQQKAQLLDAQNTLKQKVAFAWQAYLTRKQNVDYAVKQVKYYEEFVQKLTKKRELGTASLFNVLDAESKYFESLNTLIGAKIDRDVSVYSLLAELGKLDIGDIQQ